jgi:hypothetical protein
MSAVSIAARNAANAQHSTGPATAEGKARSSRNALRHGLTSQTVVLAHESAEAYEAVRQSLFDTHRPGTEREEQLVTRMAECWWRLTRALRVESEFLGQRADAISEENPDLTGEAALAAMFMEPTHSKGYRLFLRYLTNAQNSWRQACSEFEKVRQARELWEREECLINAMYGSPESAEESAEESEESEYTAEPEDLGEPEFSDPVTPTGPADPTAGFVSYPGLTPARPRPIGDTEGRLAA